MIGILGFALGRRKVGKINIYKRIMDSIQVAPLAYIHLCIDFKEEFAVKR